MPFESRPKARIQVPPPPALIAAEAAPDVMTTEQAAECIGCSVRHLEQLLREKKLPGVKIGKCWRVPRLALVEELNRRARRNMPEVLVVVHKTEPVKKSPYDPARYAPWEKPRGRPRLPLPPTGMSTRKREP